MLRKLRKRGRILGKIVRVGGKLMWVEVRIWGEVLGISYCSWRKKDRGEIDFYFILFICVDEFNLLLWNKPTLTSMSLPLIYQNLYGFKLFKIKYY